ncbi:hypothetical protein Hypma_004626 [Hypsizygus marmoreus]|uniref:F-box domain-containing protein n=1 Tax=Hypsizygus marmoreus TaxID=39966 RepID=A0A369K2Y2_HYPMA|nr:hypothetical protein Hypma_004626 [Hypsizygus marmoreus]
MPSTPIPQEIIDNITDCLHDDRKTLATCLQVSRKFRPRSEKHLFNTITLTYPAVPRPGYKHPAQHLLDVLLDHPMLARHIRHFRVFGFVEGYYQSQTDDPNSLYSLFINDSSDTVFPRLFALLARHSSLRSFTLYGNPSIAKLCEEDGGCLPKENFSLLLMDLFRQTKVAHLSLSGLVRFPLSRVVESARHLRRLRLQQMICRMSDALVPVGGVQRPLCVGALESNLGLESLELDEASLSCVYRRHFDQLSRTRFPFPFPHLRELIIYGNVATMLGVPSKLIADVATTLEFFSWEVMGNQYMPTEFNPPALVDLKPAANLHSLRFAILDCSDVMFTYLPWIVSSLESMDKLVKLEELEIFFTIPGPMAYNHSSANTLYPLFTEHDAWASALDRLLTDRSRFPSLNTVHIVLEYRRYEYTTWQLDDDGGCLCIDTDVAAVEKIDQDMEEKLGMLEERGMLDLKVVQAAYECRGLEFLDQFI